MDSFRFRQQVQRIQSDSILKGRQVIGFTGYTILPRESSYVEKAQKLVRQIFEFFIACGPEKYGMVYGSSNSGIDAIVEKVWIENKDFGIPLVGVTCLEFLEWVPDEMQRPPVLVCKKKDDYFRVFRELLDLLICTGGREHVLNYDLQTIGCGKRVLVCNCAPEIAGFSEGKVNNVAGLLESNLTVVSLNSFAEEFSRVGFLPNSGGETFG